MQRATATTVPANLIDALWPATGVRQAVVVVWGALLVALLAQVRIPLPFTPVPITGQTFGVVLVGAGLGVARGGAALLLYLLLGLVGLPFFAGGQGGPEHVFGATGGYLVAFVPAAMLVGWLARRGLDRRPVTAFLAFQAGSLVIFTLGVTGLMLTLDVSLWEACCLGWWPFVAGDLLKTAVAAGLFPAVWRLVGDHGSEDLG